MTFAGVAKDFVLPCLVALMGLAGCGSLEESLQEHTAARIDAVIASYRAAAAKVFSATHQRCRVHWMRNALAHVPPKQRPAAVA
jgi:hypothetical protein